MSDQNSINLEWVCGEGVAKDYAARVSSDGGQVVDSVPFVPPPEEADLYSDAQFDPLVIVGAVLASGMVLRYVRELVLDLKGREIAILDFSGTKPQVRVVPVGKASQIIMKSPDGTIERFSPSEIDKIEQNLAALLSPAK
ncbi:hypothetical protein [Geoalkalibacter halelectricus]|uniref:hypothetical protein n=1 Tax=Geoalkalibacter halelectricus TaxID=2847045 RepID=UPI003D2257F6